MERAVALWDNDSLTIHLIKNDLQNLRALYEITTESKKPRNMLSLHIPIFRLLGIYEYPLQMIFLKYYRLRRRAICEAAKPSGNDFHVLAESIFKGLIRKRAEISDINRQPSALVWGNKSYFNKRLCISIIQNDIAYRRVGLKTYPLNLEVPVFWIMKVWDPAHQKEITLKYLTLLSSTIDFSLQNDEGEFITLAENVYGKLENVCSAVDFL